MTSNGSYAVGPLTEVVQAVFQAADDASALGQTLRFWTENEMADTAIRTPVTPDALYALTEYAATQANAVKSVCEGLAIVLDLLAREHPWGGIDGTISNN